MAQACVAARAIMGGTVDIIPAVHVERFEQLKPGDLFIHLDGKRTFYALKTQPAAKGDRSSMVLMGPSFTQDDDESCILSWQPTTVVSLGNNFSILPSLNPASWALAGSTRSPVCLAITDKSAYICTNGGPSRHDYFPCFVDVKSGEIFEGRPPSQVAMFTNTWEVAVLDSKRPPLSILKYPLT